MRIFFFINNISPNDTAEAPLSESSWQEIRVKWIRIIKTSIRFE
jgi:hypothetical protein